jgi:hypothetical protein
MGMNVFLGLRYGVMDDSRDTASITGVVNNMLRNRLEK